MATKNLAKQLGLIRRSSVTSLSSKNPTRPKSKQFFDYLIIIDFESTCWRDTKHYGQEIIEFPAVLLNTTNGQVESEFHTYVQPQEHPILSEFCTELTGIKQDQVEEGVPLKICLSQFCSWIQTIQTEKTIAFISAPSSNPSPEDKLCAFVTWSDWDLEVCLLYECKRKQLRKPDILNSWIDLRATYKNFYNRKPKGLNGALQDLGITFSGREHSGLDDSRNTARLAWRMICDGCMMKITKSLDKVRPKVNPAVLSRSGNTSLIQSTPARNEKVAEASRKSAVSDGNFAGLRCDNDKSKAFATSSETRVVESEVPAHGTSNYFKLVENDKPTKDQYSTQSLLSPQTLINGLSVPFGNRRSRISSCNSSMNLTSGIQIGKFSATLSDNSSLGSGLVLVSTTISSINSETDSDMSSSSECLSMLSDWEDVAVIRESEDIAVIQESEDIAVIQESEHKVDPQMHSLKSMALKSPNNSVYKIFDNQNTKGCASSHRTSSVVYKSPTTTVYNVGEVNKKACSAFKLPDLVSNHSNSTKQPFSAFKACKPIENDFASINKPTFNLSMTTANKSKNFMPVANVMQKSKCSTLLPYFSKRKLSTTQFVSPPKKQPFTIYKDDKLSNVSLPLTRAPCQTPSSSIFNSSINVNQSSKVVSNGKVTPPLCNCGRRSKRLTVSSVGPNQGRAFYCCPVGKRVEGKKKSCGYFKWDQTIIEKPPSPFITAATFHSRDNSVISSNSFSSSPKRSLCLRPSMRM